MPRRVEISLFLSACLIERWGLERSFRLVRWIYYDTIDEISADRSISAGRGISLNGRTRREINVSHALIARRKRAHGQIKPNVAECNCPLPRRVDFSCRVTEPLRVEYRYDEAHCLQECGSPVGHRTARTANMHACNVHIRLPTHVHRRSRTHIDVP